MVLVGGSMSIMATDGDEIDEELDEDDDVVS